MRASNNADTIGFAIRVQEHADGTVTASAPQHPSVAPITAHSIQVATQALKNKLQELAGRGFRP